MYYLASNESKHAAIYGYEPEDPHITVDELPERPCERRGYTLRLCADMATGTAWWDYEKLPTREESLIADLQAKAKEQDAVVSALEGAAINSAYQIILLELGVL